MKKIIDAIQEFIKARKIARDFKKSIFGGIKVVVKDEDVDKIYSLQEYESFSRLGPHRLPVRAIKSQVYDWCLKAKGIIRISEEFRTEYGIEEFYFSRAKDAEEFKKVFNLRCA